MSRRIHTYRDGYGFNFWNLVSTVGAFVIAASFLIFFWNVYVSKRRAPSMPAPGPDPWDARSLEWSIPSPTPEHNFDDEPIVTQFDEFWHQKYQEDDNGRLVQVATGAEVAMTGDGSRAHLPSPSYWPIVLAASFPLIGYGLIFNLAIAAVGGAVLLAGMVGWALEPPDDEDLPPHGHGDDHGGGHGEEALPAGDGPGTEAEVTADV